MGPRAPRRPGLRGARCWAGKTTSVPGNPRAAEVCPHPRPGRGTCSAPGAEGQISPRGTHLRRGRGAPNAARAPLSPPPRRLGPLPGTRTCQGEGGPYLRETLALRSLGQRHGLLTDVRRQQSSRSVRRKLSPVAKLLPGCRQSGNFLRRRHRRRRRPGARPPGGACALGRERGATAPA